jgi:transposase InsO family protein
LAQATGEYRQSYKHERPHSRLDGKAPVEYLNERLSA